MNIGKLILFGGHLLLVPVFAWSQIAYFTPAPTWESPEPNATRSVAVGDIDLDGDLDLVCGNTLQANTLFLSENGTFGISSAWFPAVVDRTRSVAFGDIDGDGDLDLVCGNFAGHNTLYINDGGVLNTTPADTLSTANSGESLALGDLDNDGDLDVVFGIPLFPNAIFFNEAGTFPGPPVLIGGPSETRSLTLGDVDGDGYLDVVEGNIAGREGPGRNHVYLNHQGVVDSLPSWTSDAGHQTLGVELADINGDGRLDLICANYDQSNTIYYGQSDALLDTLPSWESGPMESSYDIDAGDVDSDGDIDLIFANAGQSNALYVNNLTDSDVTELAADPVWLTDGQDRTIAVAFGDIDGDGDLDLVCGNSDQLSTAYLNLAPPLDIMPAWESAAPAVNRTKSLALADIDGDGDLDLVCGNGGAEPMVNTFYANNGGRFEDAPSWSSTDLRRTASIALGDVNRDDRIDFVCGNQGVAGETNTAYENDGTPFPMSPSWTSTLEKVTTGVALGDVNGDGFLDLVCGNGADSSTVYLNTGSGLDTLAAWRSSIALKTSGIALGDVDGDGDLDLVCGNNGDPNTLFRNGGTMFATTPAWYSSLELFTNDVALGDIDGDGDLDLVCANNPEANTAYFNEGGTFVPSAGWSSRPPARATTSVALGDLDGDGDLDLVCGNELFQPNTIYVNEGGALERSPGWLSGRLYDTEDVVLGDVDGDGDVDAVFANENAPNTLYLGSKNPAYRGDAAAPTHQLTNNTAFLSSVKARRIGPNTYRIVFSLVDVESDPAWILVEYQFEGDPTWHPADVGGGGARVGTFPTSPVVLVDSLDWDTSRVPSDTRDITLRLTTIEVPQRVGVVRRSPRYLVDIGQIPLVDTFARPSSGSEFFETRDVIVELRLPPGITRDQARLHYRRGGESAYEEATFEAGSPLPFARIPSDWVGERGVEYWVEAQAPTETLTDPRKNPSQNPHAIRVTVTNLQESSEHQGGRYRLMSIPLALENSLSIIRVLQDDIGFPDITRWRLFAYDAADSIYLELPNDSILAFEQGRGYWLIANATHRIDTAPVFGRSAPTDSAAVLALEPGWNLIGQPFVFPVSWASVGVDPAIVEPPVAWRGDHYDYDQSVLQPWEGYWINNISGSQYLLRIPPQEAAPPASQVAGAGGGPGDYAWRIRVEATSGGAADVDNMVGVKDGARTEWDSLDRSEAPLGPGRSVALYFPHRDWKKGRGRYTIDVRGGYEALDAAALQSFGLGPGAWGQLWRFDVAKSFSDASAGNEVTLDFSGVDTVPPEARVLLIDRDLKRVVDLRQEGHYAFYQGKRDFVTSDEQARFVLLVGDETFADSHEDELAGRPAHTVLRANRPNPFNPMTIIRYEIAETAPVTIQIYDARGARVRDLYSGTRQPGIYEVPWSATNDSGQPVASGIYFCRLVAGKVTETRKMLLLK